jgi:hypothetical protein
MRRRAFLILAFAALPVAALANGKPEKPKGEKKKGGGESYVQLPAVTATTMRPTGRRGVLTVETGLDIPEATLRTRAEASVPRIQAAFVQVIQTYAAGLTPGTAPNLDFLAAELQREADRVLGKKGSKLLLGSVLVN